MDERRILPRWQVKREARVWLPEAHQSHPCIIEDLNLKGMCVSFSQRLPQETPMNLSLALEGNSDFIKIEAQIPWTKEEQGRYVYGMFFNKVMEADKDKIDAYIVNHCAEQFKDKWWAQ